jgi:F-type H+-transporting ATPase subunit epsilon
MVIARTAEGDLGALADHAPVLSILLPSVVEITTADGEQVRAAVEDGFLSIANNRVSILSEDAFLADEIDVDAARAEVEKLQDEGDSLALQLAEAKVRAAEKTS